MDSTPGLGRYPRVGNGNPLQYYCLGNPMDRGVWQATVHGVPKSPTGLSTAPSMKMTAGVCNVFTLFGSYILISTLDY